MAYDPKTLERAIEEVGFSFQSENDLAIERIQVLRCLNTCLEESMRDKSSSFIMLLSATACSQDLVYCSTPVGPPLVVVSVRPVRDAYFAVCASTAICPNYNRNIRRLIARQTKLLSQTLQQTTVQSISEIRSSSILISGSQVS